MKKALRLIPFLLLIFTIYIGLFFAISRFSITGKITFTPNVLFNAEQGRLEGNIVLKLDENDFIPVNSYFEIYVDDTLYKTITLEEFIALSDQAGKGNYTRGSFNINGKRITVIDDFNRGYGFGACKQQHREEEREKRKYFFWILPTKKDISAEQNFLLFDHTGVLSYTDIINSISQTYTCDRFDNKYVVNLNKLNIQLDDLEEGTHRLTIKLKYNWTIPWYCPLDPNKIPEACIIPGEGQGEGSPGFAIHQGSRNNISRSGDEYLYWLKNSRLICGSDCRTYPNECVAKCYYRVDKLYDGLCMYDDYGRCAFQSVQARVVGQDMDGSGDASGTAKSDSGPGSGEQSLESKENETITVLVVTDLLALVSTEFEVIY